jgi:hypothetical protein
VTGLAVLHILVRCCPVCQHDPVLCEFAGELGEQKDCRACTELLSRVLLQTSTDKSAHRRPPVSYSVVRLSLFQLFIQALPPNRPRSPAKPIARPSCQPALYSTRSSADPGSRWLCRLPLTATNTPGLRTQQPHVHDPSSAFAGAVFKVALSAER